MRHEVCAKKETNALSKRSDIDRNRAAMDDRHLFTDKICNRHIARTLTELEDIGCPDRYIEIVRGNMKWLRSDLKEHQAAKNKQKGNER